MQTLRNQLAQLLASGAITQQHATLAVSLYRGIISQAEFVAAVGQPKAGHMLTLLRLGQ